MRKMWQREQGRKRRERGDYKNQKLTAGPGYRKQREKKKEYMGERTG